jgi:hypothetical protein
LLAYVLDGVLRLDDAAVHVRCEALGGYGVDLPIELLAEEIELLSDRTFRGYRLLE